MSLVLAHLSDAHIGPMPRPHRRELLGKRFTGYLNWTRGRHLIHDMDVLASLVADLKAHRPDHIAMTGDILNIGLKAEYPLARLWLETLGSPHDVSFVPGNHDAYARATMPDLSATFVPWITGDAGIPAYPYLRVRGNVALIGLSSAVPTPPFIASGRLGRPQCEACASLLSKCAREGLVRVVMIHHPPYRGGARLGRTLSDADLFEAMIRRAGAELVIHGHNHRLSVAHLEGPTHKVPVVGVVSASALRGGAGHHAGYNLFEIDGTAKEPRITARMRGLLPGRRAIGDLRPIAL
ncbi:MAG: metallophosphoesterase family protein [Xanthobacteraceae bacterium]